jgi:hypothetical protein
VFDGAVAKDFHFASQWAQCIFVSSMPESKIDFVTVRISLTWDAKFVFSTAQICSNHVSFWLILELYRLLCLRRRFSLADRFPSQEVFISRFFSCGAPVLVSHPGICASFSASGVQQSMSPSWRSGQLKALVFVYRELCAPQAVFAVAASFFLFRFDLRSKSINKSYVRWDSFSNVMNVFNF